MGGVQARTDRKRAQRKIKQELGIQRSRGELFSNLQESQLRQGQKAELAGFAGARRGVELAGNRARQGAVDLAKQAQGSLDQSIVSRGLLGTSTGANLNLGLQDRTSRQLADIDSQLAMALGGLGMQEGAVRRGHSQQLGDVFRQRQQFEGEYGQAMLDLFGQGG